jgi:tellurite resistance protein TehA-like permease
MLKVNEARQGEELPFGLLCRTLGRYGMSARAFRGCVTTQANCQHRFTWCMNAGIVSQPPLLSQTSSSSIHSATFSILTSSPKLGTLLHNLPYNFSGLPILSNIFFMLDLTLYIIFSLIYILHFFLYGRHAIDELLDNVVELCLFPCWTIAFMTLVSFVALPISNAPWAGRGWMILAVAMWWIVTVWMFGVLLGVFTIIITRHTILDNILPTLIIIPAVGVATLAIVGAEVAMFAKDISAGLAVPILIMSICALGVGFLLGFILLTFLFYQLLAKGWPTPAQTATLFIMVGPMGQSAGALQLIGSAADAKRHFANYNRGFFLSGESARAMHAACVLLALLMTGLGFIWLSFAFIAMFQRAWERKLKWAPTWNAVIFPTATLVTSVLLLAEELDSAFFRVLTAVFVVFLTAMFLVNFGFTVVGIWKGKLLIIRDDPRVNARIHDREKAN